MDLNTFFQISVSVFCIIATIFMIIMFVLVIMLRVQVSKLIKNLDDILDVVQTTANNAKDFTERTIESLEAFKNNFFTFEFIRRIVTELIKLIKDITKGAKNGKEK